jgi:plasmid stabilization system protein ParE
MTFIVTVLGRARTDIAEIHSWLYQRSPEGAERWLAALEASTAGLEQQPLSFGLAPESVELGREIRERFFKTPRGRVYRLLFLIVDHDVRILRVRGPGQALVTRRDIATQ